MPMRYRRDPDGGLSILGILFVCYLETIRLEDTPLEASRTER